MRGTLGAVSLEIHWRKRVCRSPEDTTPFRRFPAARIRSHAELPSSGSITNSLTVAPKPAISGRVRAERQLSQSTLIQRLLRRARTPPETGAAPCAEKPRPPQPPGNLGRGREKTMGAPPDTRPENGRAP